MGESLVTIPAFCNSLIWAQADAGALDAPSNGRLAFEIRSTTAEKTAVHQVVFVGVLGLEWTGATPSALEWENLEFTAVSLERAASRWRVWFNFWDVSEATFTCEQIQLDDREVRGEGEWFQDQPVFAGAS